MNVYDFDKTIFYPDSSCKFILYCLRKNPGAFLRVFPGILTASARYAFGSIPTKTLKEKLFAFLPYMSDAEKTVIQFWDDNYSRIQNWYLKQKRPDDLVISASPAFLVSEACRRLGVELIATRMDIRTGKIKGENCHDTEKVLRFRALYPNADISEFYSDSVSDAPLARIAAKAFLVNKGKVSAWQAK